MELLDRIRAGDKDAFEELMNAYGPRLYARLLSRLGDRELADRAFKETMLGFFRTVARDGCEDATEALLTERIDREAEALAESALCGLIAETARSAEEAVHRGIEEGGDAWEAPEAEPARADAAACPGLSPTESERTEKEKRRNRRTGLCAAFLAVLLAGMLWVTAGGLMTAGLLPFCDLGYTWFNANVLPVFV